VLADRVHRPGEAVGGTQLGTGRPVRVVPVMSRQASYEDGALVVAVDVADGHDVPDLGLASVEHVLAPHVAQSQRRAHVAAELVEPDDAVGGFQLGDALGVDRTQIGDDANECGIAAQVGNAIHYFSLNREVLIFGRLCSHMDNCGEALPRSPRLDQNRKSEIIIW